jgi:CHAT domain-containing protein/predicted negative regulator of RcsB-dependent stress response
MTYREAGMREWRRVFLFVVSHPLRIFAVATPSGLCIALITIWCSSGRAQEQTPAPVKSNSSSQVTASDFTPVTHKIVEKDIEAGGTHASNLTLKQGHFIEFEIECWGTDIKFVIYDLTGAAVSRTECYRTGSTRISLVAQVSTVYRFELSTESVGSQIGHYRLRVRQLRRASTDDSSRMAAEISFVEAERLRVGLLKGTGDEAIKKYEEARTRWLAIGDKYNAIYATMNAGVVYQSLRRFDQALVSYETTFKLSRGLRDGRIESDVLNHIAYLHAEVGNPRDALGNARRALTLSLRTGNHKGQAQAHHTIGDVYYNLGDMSKALSHHQKALQIWQQLRNYQGQVNVLVSFGYAYTETSNIPAALDSYNNALSISRAANDDHSQAIALRALANLQTKLGENQEAFKLFFQALNLLSPLEDQYLEAIILGGLAYTYEYVGEWQLALEYYGRALAIFKRIGHKWGEAEAEMPIGEVYYLQGEYQAAIKHYEQAVTLFRELNIPRWEGMTIRNMGLVYAALGDEVKALECYRQALGLIRAGQDQRHEAYTLNYMGQIFEGRGKKQEALAYYNRALHLSRIAADPAGESLTLYNVAHAERDRGNLRQARAHIESALQIAESLRTKVTSQKLRAAYFASTRQHYDLYIDILMRLHEERPGEGFDVAAFNMSERARARSLLESLREAKVDIREGVPVELLERERALEQLLRTKSDRHAQLLGGKQQSEAEVVAKEIDQIIAQHDEVEALIKASSPHFASLSQPQPLSLHDIQQRLLDDDTLLLEYALGDDKSYLWAVTRTEIQSFELPGRDEIENAARSFYSLLKSIQPVPGETFEQRQARASEAARQLPANTSSLSELLLGRVGSKLNTKRLLIVPDGALQYIPFQALILPASASMSRQAGDSAPAGPQYLIYNHEIINEPSASTLALLINETANRQPAPKSVAVLADAVFEIDDPRIRSENERGGGALPDRFEASELHQAFRDAGSESAGGQIPRLLASRDEASAIIALTPAGTALNALGFEANRATATSSELSKYRIVHFATHAILNNQSPDLSGIVLSLFDQRAKPQDGFLRLHDIYNLHLSADLVVLSACNTALGRDVRGEGLVGLTRGFMHAGASSVVASLWKVDDDATAELMKNLYTFMLQEGLSPSDALRHAQLEMLKRRQWREPYYWAAFVIQGRYDNKLKIDNNNSHTERLIGPALAVLLLSLLGGGVVFQRRKRKKLLIQVDKCSVQENND